MERERLTITLRKDILKLVDQSIDGAKLRNRSHAIEYFLSRELSPKTVKVVVVLHPAERTTYQAGAMQMGAGTAPAGSAENLRSIFSTLSEQDFKDVILVGSDTQALEAAAVDADKQELNAKTIELDLGGKTVSDLSLNMLGQYVQNETFIYWDGRFPGPIQLSDLLEYHKSAQGDATAALSTTSLDTGIDTWAVIYGRMIRQVGGSQLRDEGALPVAGVFVFEPPILRGPEDPTRNIFTDILPRLAEEGNLSGFTFTMGKVEKPQPAPATVRR